MNWMNPRIKMLVARETRTGLVGYEKDGRHQLPWYISSDLQWFKAMSLNTTIVVGRKTWESFGKRPLPGRPHIVVTSEQHENTEQVRYMNIVQVLDYMANSEEMFTVSGGPTLYRAVLDAGLVEAIYVTEVIAPDLELPPHEFCSYLDMSFQSLVKDGWKCISVMHELDRSKDKYDYSINLWINCSAGCVLKDRRGDICDSVCPREIKLELNTK